MGEYEEGSERAGQKDAYVMGEEKRGILRHRKLSFTQRGSKVKSII